MPREAPVTIATLFAFVAICVLLRDVRRSAVVEEIMALLVWRIIVHYSALLSDKSEQKYGPFRCHAGFRPRCRKTQFHAGGRRLRPAPLHAQRCGEAVGEAPGGAASATHDARRPEIGRAHV